ncbi:MAG: cycloartenol synthase [Deltaproteobacteria bacterium]|nr:cycloartenol synthase [Deltaproteobacteria bacterium]
MKKRRHHLLALAGLLCLLCSAATAQAEEIRLGAAAARSDLSLKNELQHAIERGLGWLAKNQNPGGYWSQPDHPALTGLVLTAYMGEPSGRTKANPPDFVHNGYKYLLDCVKPDGGVYVREMANYNTSVVMMALLTAANPAFEPVILRARNFEVGLQDDFDKKGETDNPLDGGVGYGGKYQHSDMSNTMFALESIYYTKHLARDSAGADQAKDLNWQAAIKFIERCQNLPGHNDQPWASDDPLNKGGFIYFPGDSKAGEMELSGGRKALRSYGSISYAGLLSYIYADLQKDDPRVVAALDWLRKNYTLEENPGLGQDGLYYYYHTMAKALAACGVNELVLADGSKVNWRTGLAKKLLNLQNGEGFWMNENGRWWEKDPVLVTSYAIIVLEIIYRGL